MVDNDRSNPGDEPAAGSQEGFVATDETTRVEDRFKGHRFGKYILGDYLRREGNYIETFEATQELTSALVEIRILNVSPADRNVLGKRFLHELSLLADFDHPGIVHPLDVGEELGRQYYTVARRNSLTLEEYLKNAGGRLQSLDEVLRFGEILADALGVLHGEGLLHRGISSNSVHVDLDDHRPFFGECSAMKDIRAAYGLSLLGVPSLAEIPLTPENATDDEWTVRTDLYLLCALIHRMVTGNKARPVQAPKEMEKAFARLASGPDVPTALATMGDLDGLGKVILKGLAFDPAARFGSTDELNDKLRRIARRRNLKLFVRTESQAAKAALTPQTPAPKDDVERRRQARRQAAAQESLGTGTSSDSTLSFLWIALAAGALFGLVGFVIGVTASRTDRHATPSTTPAVATGHSAESPPASPRTPADETTAEEANEGLLRIARETERSDGSAERFDLRWRALNDWVQTRSQRPRGVGTHVEMLQVRLQFAHDPQEASSRLDRWFQAAVEAQTGDGEGSGGDLDSPRDP